MGSTAMVATEVFVQPVLAPERNQNPAIPAMPIRRAVRKTIFTDERKLGNVRMFNSQVLFLYQEF